MSKTKILDIYCQMSPEKLYTFILTVNDQVGLNKSYEVIFDENLHSNIKEVRGSIIKDYTYIVESCISEIAEEAVRKNKGTEKRKNLVRAFWTEQIPKMVEQYLNEFGKELDKTEDELKKELKSKNSLTIESKHLVKTFFWVHIIHNMKSNNIDRSFILEFKTNTTNNIGEISSNMQDKINDLKEYLKKYTVSSGLQKGVLDEVDFIENPIEFNLNNCYWEDVEAYLKNLESLYKKVLLDERKNVIGELVLSEPTKLPNGDVRTSTGIIVPKRFIQAILNNEYSWKVNPEIQKNFARWNSQSKLDKIHDFSIGKGQIKPKITVLPFIKKGYFLNLKGEKSISKITDYIFKYNYESVGEVLGAYIDIWTKGKGLDLTKDENFAVLATLYNQGDQKGPSFLPTVNVFDTKEKTFFKYSYGLRAWFYLYENILKQPLPKNRNFLILVNYSNFSTFPLLSVKDYYIQPNFELDFNSIDITEEIKRGENTSK